MHPEPTAQTAAEHLDSEFGIMRGALLAHCYQMVGSYHDAEDLVQETYLRARRGIATFEQRSSLSTWLYRIATNTCLTALNHPHRRVLPSGLGAPASDADAPSNPDLAAPWLQPLPDCILAPAGQDPGEAVVHRDSIRLALIAALQYLPPRQRAVFLLREVLAWPAEEVSTTLEISVPAVKSLLQRARTRIYEVSPDLDDTTWVDESLEQQLLERYIQAFVTSDVSVLNGVIHEDFSLEVPPSRTWFKGLDTCLDFLDRHAVFQAGDWHLIPTRVNGQPAAASYLRDEAGCHRASGFCVLTVSGDRIQRVAAFKDPWLIRAAGFPAQLPAPDYQSWRAGSSHALDLDRPHPPTPQRGVPVDVPCAARRRPSPRRTQRTRRTPSRRRC